jgi:hypothetical protein
VNFVLLRGESSSSLSSLFDPCAPAVNIPGFLLNGLNVWNGLNDWNPWYVVLFADQRLAPHGGLKTPLIEAVMKGDH